MDGGIDADVSLDYIEFHVFPSQKRYEASVCRGNNCEVAASGSLEPLLFHCPQIKALFSGGSDDKIKLIASEDVNGSRWFAKSTVLRFLEIISSPEVLDATTGLRNEISQLEEARTFHLSLYGKGSQKTVEGEVADYKSEANGCPKDTTDSVSSDDSKNELLRAMYLRLTALREELSNALVKAASITLSREEITDIEKFCSLIEATDLRKSFCNLVELGLENGTETKSAGMSESGESSDSVVEEQPSVERSRTLIRSASPRRSASPMRRVQIGRSGSRRSTPLTIKSLNYFHRERLVSQNDEVEVEHSDGEDETEQPSKKPVSNNARRISVQDAISLFESKQRDQTSGVQKTNSFSGPNKSVLRRWSAGPGEGSKACRDTAGSDNSVELVPSNLSTGGDCPLPPESKLEQHGLSEGHDVQPDEGDSKPECHKQSESNVGCREENDTPPSQSSGMNERQTASAEWSRQKEAELDQLLMKMMETKTVKYTNTSQDNSKIPKVSGGKKGGFYDRDKEKGNEKKLGRENAGKQADRAKQQAPDERKTVMDSAKRIHGSNKHTVNSQKPKKTPSPSADAVKEISKSSVFSKASPRTSSLPATRKSWPSAPSPRTTVISTAKTPPETASTGTTTRRKSQPPSATTALSSKKPVSQPKPKSLKANPSDKGKVVNSVNKTMQQPAKKNPKLTKAKVLNVSTDSTLSEKPSLYSKVTKKSSVVPLEPKPFLRKGSKGVSPVSRSKVSSQPDEPSKDSKDETLPVGNEIISASSNVVMLQQDVDLEPLKDHIVFEPEFEIKSPEKSQDLETPIQVALAEDGRFQKTPEVSSNNEVIDELTISPSAWVDQDEHEDHALGDDSICPVESSSPNIAPAGMPSPPRVRHSLSQMLLEEISEPDVNEWGNAENPPTMVFQKDAPRGLKKLLKFARKSKTDGNSTGFSSPSVFSEGEDDAEESKSSGKGSENLLKMATLHGKSNGFARSNIKKSSAQSLSGKVQEGRNFSSVAMTKAPRSFFSLSAFGSGK